MLIKINNLEVLCSVGVFDWEKEVKQKLILNLQIKLKSLKSCESDNITDTLDYDNLSRELREKLSQRHYELIEAMAFDIKSLVELKPIVSDSQVEVLKPNAIANAGPVSVLLDFNS